MFLGKIAQWQGLQVDNLADDLPPVRPSDRIIGEATPEIKALYHLGEEEAKVVKRLRSELKIAYGEAELDPSEAKIRNQKAISIKLALAEQRAKTLGDLYAVEVLESFPLEAGDMPQVRKGFTVVAIDPLEELFSRLGSVLGGFSGEMEDEQDLVCENPDCPIHGPAVRAAAAKANGSEAQTASTPSDEPVGAAATES